MEKKSLIDLLEQSQAQFGALPYLWEKKTDKFEPTSYTETKELVYQMGAGLMSLGLEKGDRVGLLAEGQNAWIVSELGVLYNGAINVPLSIKLEANEVFFRLLHSESSMVIVSKSQVPKIEEVRDRLPLLKTVIVIDSESTDVTMIRYDEVLEKGKTYLSENTAVFEERFRSVQPDDACNICYTSGTTADPKGIILSHYNYYHNAYQSTKTITIDSTFRTLAILPWDHAFAHTCCLYCFMMVGASIGSVQIGKNGMETIRNVPINIKELKPHMLMSVPALSKNFKKNIETNIRKKGKTTERLFAAGMKVAYAYNGEGIDKGKGSKALLAPLVSLFDKILFSKIREAFGGELKYFVGGGALLETELQRFFAAIGVPICQGYGLSEASPVISTNTLKDIHFGSSGKPVGLMDIKICDTEGKTLPNGEKGEIVIRGGNVMKGYWRNEEATAETIKDNWLHTGDMGYLGTNGFLYVLGRFKSLLIGNDGEKYSPEGIEEAIVENSKYIDQCMLYNNQNPYTVGLVVPNVASVKTKLEENGLDVSSEEGQKYVMRLIKNDIDQYRKNGKYKELFPERWLPTATVIMPEVFSEKNNLVNSTMKMVRGKVTERFEKELDFAYTPKAKEINNEVNYKNLKELIGN